MLVEPTRTRSVLAAKSETFALELFFMSMVLKRSGLYSVRICDYRALRPYKKNGDCTMLISSREFSSSAAFPGIVNGSQATLSSYPLLCTPKDSYKGS